MAEVVVDSMRLVYDVQGEGPPVLLVCGTGMPQGRYVEIPDAPHVALAPEVQDFISAAFVEFLAEAHPAHRAQAGST